MTTIRQALARSRDLVAESDTPKLDVEVLLAKVLKQDKTYLYTWPERELSGEQQKNFDQLVRRRAEGVPIAYLLGTREFWSLNLEVSEDTLIPRPETELLVEIAVSLFSSDTERRVVDLGTGTGAVALAIASECAAWRVMAVDKSNDIVKLAERNRNNLGLNNVLCVVSDWCDNLPVYDFDLIVSNPPYVRSDDAHLACGDVRFEPKSALVAQENGLSDIRQIAAQAKNHLKRGGYLLFEHGWDQAEPVTSILTEQGFGNILLHKDLAGNDRATLCQWLGG